MKSASIALELLTTQDTSRATELAEQLNRLNIERAQMQNGVWDQVRSRVEAEIAQGNFKYGVVVADPGWHEGVVGIVASRVTETFRRPAVVIAIRDGIGKGSARSYAGKDVLAALRSAASNLLGFGGHKYASGLSIDPKQILKFTDDFNQALSGLGEDAESRPLLLEGDCSLEDFDLRTLQELERLGPFGPGNPEAIFSFKAAVARHQILKGRH
ncbi:MAG: DHHA1 domain-containing protein, partial [Bdellovibrionota bacterium]